jgi:chlorobactene glucosyltransferase
LAARTLEVRMYRSAREVWDGFGKNLFVLTGGGLLTAPLFFALFALIHLLPWALFPLRPGLWAAPLIVLLLCRLLTALVLREPLRAIPFQVVGALLVPAIAARSLLNFRLHRLEWKGRRLNADVPAVEETPR